MSTSTIKACDEKTSVIVVPRDRFSPTLRCIETIMKNTEQPYELIVVFGGVPERYKMLWQENYSGKVKFIFTDHYLSPAEGRNIGLRAATTRLAALVDNDVMVRKGWLKKLVECQVDTQAAMVLPVILEYGKKIHCAGNRYYVSYENGTAYAQKELPLYGLTYTGETNLKREEIDYGELHCQLVEVKTALDVKAYDERIMEVGECDSGLSWQKAGHKMFLEPSSAVNYELPMKITDPDDAKFFAWRWDMREILRGYDYYKEKWGEDITEYGIFKDFLLKMNRTLGFLPRLWTNSFTLWLSNVYKDGKAIFMKLLSIPAVFYNRAFSKHLGYYEWPDYSKQRSEQ